MKVHALNSRLFPRPCEEMHAEHTRLLSYPEVTWLSTGGSLARVSELREPPRRILLEKQSPLAAHFSDKNGPQNLLACVTYSACLTHSRVT